MHPLDIYISELREIRSSGEAVPETSYHGALAALLNEVGKSLKPRVRCIINPRNRGAGIPDGGLFTPDQFQRHDKTEPIGGQIPSRGVIEIKPTNEDAFVTAEGKRGKILENELPNARKVRGVSINLGSSSPSFTAYSVFAPINRSSGDTSRRCSGKRHNSHCTVAEPRHSP